MCNSHNLAGVKCEDLPSLAPGIHLHPSPGDFGSVLELYCDEGYKLQGGEIMCSQNAVWELEGDPPNCTGNIVTWIIIFIRSQQVCSN